MALIWVAPGDAARTLDDVQPPPATSSGSASCPAEPAICTWEKTYGGTLEDKAYGVLPLEDGGLIIVGKTFHDTRYDAWIMRVTRSGARIWHRVLGGPDTDQLYAVVEAADGDLFVAAHTRRGRAARSDFWVMRLDLHGRLIWQRILGGAGEDRARTLVAMSDGGVVAGGFTGSKGAGKRDAWLVRLNASGALEWEQTLGGTGDDGAFHVARTRGGAIAMVGYTASGGAGNYRAWAVLLRDDGSVISEREYPRGRFSAATGVAASLDGGLVVVGIAGERSAADDRVRVFRTAPDGSLLWDRVLEGDRRATGWAIARLPDAVLVIAAATTRGPGSTSAWLVGMNDRGEMLWERVHGGPLWDRPTALAIARDGGLVLGGYTTTRGAGYEDFWILRLDRTGRL